MGACWENGPRSTSELKEAATHFERAAAQCSAPLLRAELVGRANWCRRRAAAMRVVYTGIALASAVALAAIPIAVLAARAGGGFDSESLDLPVTPFFHRIPSCMGRIAPYRPSCREVAYVR